jgi:hypothetical protein
MSEKGTAPTGNTEYDLHDITPQGRRERLPNRTPRLQPWEYVR